jgi:hypothetical protein
MTVGCERRKSCEGALAARFAVLERSIGRWKRHLPLRVPQDRGNVFQGRGVGQHNAVSTAVVRPALRKSGDPAIDARLRTKDHACGKRLAFPADLLFPTENSDVLRTVETLSGIVRVRNHGD